MREWYFDLKEFEPEVGFEFAFVVEHEGNTYDHRCRITEVIPQKKIAYTWRYEGHEGNSLVTIELLPEGDKTRLKLTHTGLDTFPKTPAFARENFEKGWTQIIGSELKKFVEKDTTLMSEEQEKQKIRDVISTWTRASAEGDTERVLSLMAEDVVFLVPGQPPMRGRAAFAAALSSFAGKMQFDGKSEIQEIQIGGEFAYCWSHLTLSVTPLPSGAPSRRAGHILSIYRKEPDGRWVLFRDANMLTAV
jgi:uncharacterized protein (TIGR02246 family)